MGKVKTILFQEGEPIQKFVGGTSEDTASIDLKEALAQIGIEAILQMA